MGNASLFVFKIALTPLKVKKIVLIIGFMVFKSTGSDSQFQVQSLSKQNTFDLSLVLLFSAVFFLLIKGSKPF